jgi:hypothetical protein
MRFFRHFRSTVRPCCFWGGYLKWAWVRLDLVLLVVRPLAVVPVLPQPPLTRNN